MSISGPRRLAVFLSLLWMGIWLVLYSLDPVINWSGFLLFAVAPVALLWGIGWVVVGFKSRSSPLRESEANRAGFHVGWPDQAAAFGKRNALFVKQLDRLRATFDAICNRDFTTAARIDSFVFIAGYTTVDDFMEILILCGNGESFGAVKLLRSMFERVVTLTYLQQHPDELDAYMNYYWIDQHKLINAVETTFKKGLVEPQKAKEAEENYQKFKNDYKITACKECGTTRPGISWTPKDVLTMAKETGLTDFIVPAYYMPMQHAHPKVKGMLERITQNAEGRVVPAERFQPALTDRVLSATHALVLYALDVQVKHFKLDGAMLSQSNDDFMEIWKSRTDPSQPFSLKS